MKKIKYLIIIFFFHYFTANANDDFDQWLKAFSNKAIKNGISKKTVDNVLYKAKFLPNVIKYDRCPKGLNPAKEIAGLKKAIVTEL